MHVSSSRSRAGVQPRMSCLIMMVKLSKDQKQKNIAGSRVVFLVTVVHFHLLHMTIPSVENQKEKGVASGFSVFLFLSFVENML
ncbi:hypothetical protein RchiOBHm_Chr1g0328001 [Rosa chinensis]|uniref:Uncharacterized protein n=1 Tax=Rosa chinensis TaxID=74649 RepID=A0A2P6SAN2_ROSCH|nr:hypothetical protein RchiOBHm_Chr1g0328001 [Rosa chinensis]